MRELRVAAVELNQTPLGWIGNGRRIREALAKVREAGATLACLPELCLTGYGCEDQFLSPGLLKRAWDVLLRLVGETRGLVVSFGLPVLHRSAVFDVAAVAVDGRLA